MNRNLILVLLCCVFSAPRLSAQSIAVPPVHDFMGATVVNTESGRFSLHWSAVQSGHEWEGLRSISSEMRGMRSVQFQHQPSSDRGDYERWARRLAIVQGAYYTVTGLWPILHMRSFEQVTGPKTDDWLVKTVGALISVVGVTLLASGLDDAPSRDLATVAVGSAAALTAVDVTYVAQGRISPIYLLDAAAETALVIGWAVTLRK